MCKPGYYANQLVGQETFNSTCTACSPGQYTDDMKAPPNNVDSEGGPIICKSCPAGSWHGGLSVDGEPAASLRECKVCPAGFFGLETGRNVPCTRCSIGWHKPDAGSGPCYVCPAGKSQNDSGRSHCSICPPGLYQGREKQPLCLPCDRGRHQPFQNMADCMSCPPGTAQNELGSSSCLPW